MISLLQRFARYYKEHGLGNATLAAASHALQIIGYKSAEAKKRSYISQKLLTASKGVVHSGTFKGMKLNPEKFWQQDDLSSQIIGTYEGHVQNFLRNRGSTSTVFIDVGAADGYFAIGMLTAGLARKSICFEISSEAHDVIRDNAAMNGVGDSVEIYGKADPQILIDIIKNSSGDKLILVDIEGAEYELMTPELIDQMAECSCTVVIELHEFYSDLRVQSSNMLKRLESRYCIELLESSEVNPNDLAILDDYIESDKYLAIDEARPSPMRWVALTPK